MKICVDPGHGGNDSGATANGIKEKVLNLTLSLYMTKRLQELGFEVTLTRQDDTFLSVNQRVGKVLASKADLCISNHINAGGGTGAEIIHSLNNDGKLANMILQNIKETGMPIRKIYSRESNSQPGKDYYFMHRLTYPQIPETLIVEYGFIDNPSDRSKLMDDSMQKELVEAVLKAISNYANVNYTGPKDKQPFAVEIIDLQGTVLTPPPDSVKLENGVTWIKARTFTELIGGVVSYDKDANKSIFDFSK